MREEASSVGVRFGLAHGRRERRWTTIVDFVLALVVLGWALAAASTWGRVHPTAMWLVSAALAAAVGHRVLLLLERRRAGLRRAPVAGAARPRATPQDLPTTRAA